MKTIFIGKTGMSYMGMGTGTNGPGGRPGGSDLAHLGVEGLKKLLLYGYDLGINWWDSAVAYQTFPHIAAALKNIPRSSVVISSKIFAKPLEKNEALQEVEQSLKEMETDYIDILLMHCMYGANWYEVRHESMSALNKAKEKGLIRYKGISVHDYEALRTAVSHPWPEVIMVPINYDNISTVSSELSIGELPKVIKLIEQGRSLGKFICGMKIMGEGKLAGDPERALNFALKSPVNCVAIGMTTEEQIKQNVELLNKITG